MVEFFLNQHQQFFVGTDDISVVAKSSVESVESSLELFYYVIFVANSITKDNIFDLVELLLHRFIDLFICLKINTACGNL